MQDGEEGMRADPIGYKARRILTKDGGLAQMKITEMHQGIDHGWVSETCGDDLQQRQVSGGLKKCVPQNVFESLLIFPSPKGLQEFLMYWW